MRVSITEQPVPGGIETEVAVVEFRGEVAVAKPDGGQTVYNPRQTKEWGYIHGLVPKEVIQEIYDAVCRGQGLGTADKYKWRIE